MKYLVAGALAITAATPALAQEAVPITSGARVEARVGWDRPVLELDASDGFDSINEKEGKSGVTYGAEVGYDIVTASNAVIGAYAGIEDSSTKECAEVFGGDRACLNAGRNITVGARVGYVLNKGLVYLKGGYSNGRATLSYNDPAAPADNFRLSDDLDGFHLGAGGEVMFGTNVYGKLEYVYTNYSGYSYDDGGSSLSLDLERHQILAGVGFRF